MNARTARKHYLIAESELSRSRLVEDCAFLAADINKIVARSERFRSVASTAALLVTGVAAFQNGVRKPKQDSGETNWVRTLLKGAGLASSVWLALQAPGRDR
jgi:hypothetical protein